MINLKIEIDIKPYKCKSVQISNKEELSDKLLEITMEHIENDVDAECKIVD